MADQINRSYGRILQRLLDENNSLYAYQKAMRILEWASCSSRPLRIYEILDGIILEPGNTNLSREKKLNNAIIDICKPILEEGPGGTLQFVHFSAKE